MHLTSTLPALSRIVQAAAHVIASGSSHASAWEAPLAAALDQLEGQQLKQVSGALVESLWLIDTSATFQRLTDRAAADQDPDFTIVSLTTHSAHYTSLCVC